MTSPQQLILFGSPGVGKSYYIRSTILPSLGIDPNSQNCISCVFHPEYSYGDFVGKLLPITRGQKVEYTFYEGHFLAAIAKALQNLLKAERQKTAYEITWSDWSSDVCSSDLLEGVL